MLQVILFDRPRTHLSILSSVLIHTTNSVHCYTYEDGSIKIATNEQLPSFDHVRFVDHCTMYAWNKQYLYRLSVENERIVINRRLFNSFGTKIINLFATQRYLLVHTEKGVFSVCQSTGVQIAKVSEVKFTKVHLITDEKNTMFGITNDQESGLKTNV